jgi:adenylate cyclase
LTTKTSMPFPKPVLAGIIAWRKFCYDLWGDTVNATSRMEAIAFPETIRVTEAVYEKPKGRYRFEGPTAVLVKGKDELLTYRLAGRRTASAPEEVELVATKLETLFSY